MNIIADFIARFFGPVLNRLKVTNPISFLAVVLALIALYWGIPYLVSYVGPDGPLVGPALRGILTNAREVLFAIALFLNIDLRSPGR